MLTASTFFKRQQTPLEFTLYSLPFDLTAFCEDIYDFCADVEDPADVEARVKTLMRVSLWWD